MNLNALLPRPKKLAFNGGYQPRRYPGFRLESDLPNRLETGFRSLGLERDEAEGLKLLVNVQDIKTCPTSGYTLVIETDQASIHASNEANAFHALATLRQILILADDRLPCLKITDTPDLAIRGFMLDISRCKVPTQQSLRELIDLLASLKYNQLQLYTEHTFAYRGHETVWQNASPLTPNEIEELDQYCYDRYIELVPNQNSFGHMERWLRHPQYHHLAESPGGFEHPIAGWKPYGSTLKPVDESLEFVDGLYEQLLSCFRSTKVNVGGDEPWELGQGFSHDLVKAKGRTRVYLDHLLRIQNLVKHRGYKMQFWGDIIINQPDLASELKEATALLWGYEVNHPFAKECQAMSRAGVEFYVVPGTSTWNSIGGRLYTAMPNIEAAAKNAKKHEAKGVLLTEWGDNGHHQSHLTSLPAIAFAAQSTWGSPEKEHLRQSCTELLPHPLTTAEYDALIAFSDAGSVFKTYLHNASWLNKSLFAKKPDFELIRSSINFKEIETAREILSSSCGNGQLDTTARILRFATEKAGDILNGVEPEAFPEKLLQRFRSEWLTRNRPGGLDEASALLANA